MNRKLLWLRISGISFWCTVLEIFRQQTNSLLFYDFVGIHILKDLECLKWRIFQISIPGKLYLDDKEILFPQDYNNATYLICPLMHPCSSQKNSMSFPCKKMHFWVIKIPYRVFRVALPETEGLKDHLKGVFLDIFVYCWDVDIWCFVVLILIQRVVKLFVIFLAEISQ